MRINAHQCSSTMRIDPHQCSSVRINAHQRCSSGRLAADLGEDHHRRVVRAAQLVELPVPRDAGL